MAARSTQTLLAKALDLEVKSARDPLNMELLGSLIELYSALNLPEAALSLAHRLARFGVDVDSRRVLFPFMLDHLTKQRDLGKLNETVRVALEMKNRSPELRRALFPALSLLGQAERAAKEWHALLAANALEYSDWENLALFMTQHGDVGGLGSLLEGNEIAFRGLGHEPLGMLCLLVSQIERDVRLAEKTLARIPPARIDDAELALQLAILAFRLGDYGLAQSAARRALRIKGKWDVVSSALRSFRSFAGEPGAIEGCRRVLVKRGVESAVRDMAGQTAVIDLLGATVPGQYIWGFVTELRDGTLSFSEKSFGPPESRYLAAPEGGGILATYSFLPNPKGRKLDRNAILPDPLEVLPYVEFRVPHVMVQRSPRLISHCFVGAPFHRDWYWEEVLLVEGEVERMVHEKTPASSELWRAAEEELARREYEEEV